MGFRCSAPRAKSAKTCIESDVFTGGQSRYGSPRPPPLPTWATHSLECAGHVSQAFQLCTSVRSGLCSQASPRPPLRLVRAVPWCSTVRSVFLRCGPIQARARFFWCRPLHHGVQSLHLLQSWKGSAPNAYPFPRCAHICAPLPPYFARSSRASRITFSFTSAKALPWICSTVRLRLKLNDWPAMAVSTCSMT